MSEVSSFYQSIRQAISNAVERLKPYRATVDSTANGLVKIQPLGGDVLDESYARLAGVKLNEDDEVVVIDLNGKPFVLGKLQRAVPTAEAVDFPFTIFANSDDAFLVKRNSSVTMLRVDTAIPGSVDVMGGAHLYGWSGEDRSGTASFDINATNGSARFGSLTATSVNSPKFYALTRTSALTSSTTSTTTFANALSLDVALPSGTWTLTAIGGVKLRHSANSTNALQVTIGGTAGPTRLVNSDANVFSMTNAEAEVSSLSGTVTVTVDYRSDVAGTSSARNPWVWVAATRTS
jgi:hypothetical protein